MSNPIEDLVPEQHRKKIYAVLTLASAVFAAWQASQGDWAVFSAAVLSFLGTGLATANTATGPKTPEPGDPVKDVDQAVDFGGENDHV